MQLRSRPNKSKIILESIDSKINRSKEKMKKPREDDVDVYNFTYDPNEEPPPKKKRKKTVNKKPPKPKVVFKNIYDQNVSKTLEALKNKVKSLQSKPTTDVNSNEEVKTNTKSITKPVRTSIRLTEKQSKKVPDNVVNVVKKTQKVSKTATKTHETSFTPVLPSINESAKSIHESNYASIRVEDIAADFEQLADHDDINYSPVHSPYCPKTPTRPLINKNFSNVSAVHNKDPLNLQEDHSFFDEQPIANSSMNASVHNPVASPWRVDFGDLPIRWQANTYVKPNMTPAVESSFINTSDVKKKHVYTNMVPHTNDSLPQIVQSSTPNLKQPSIISFIKEVAERNANKKKRGRSLTPVKANSMFENSNSSIEKTPKKAKTNNNNESPASEEQNKDKSTDKETSKESNNSAKKQSKSQKKKNKDGTFFGFDDSENMDQENVSPIKKVQNDRVRGLRSQARVVLQEINAQGPMRSAIPTRAKKPAGSEVVNILYEQIKSAEEVPQIQEKETEAQSKANKETTNIEDLTINDDSQSVHLFEDIEFVHNLQQHRRSYGKPKKLTFQQTNIDSDDNSDDAAPVDSGDEDMSFRLPSIKEKKTKKKKKNKKLLTKKEEKEAEEWAAGFNSMCKDVEEFDLVVE